MRKEDNLHPILDPNIQTSLTEGPFTLQIIGASPEPAGTHEDGGAARRAVNATAYRIFKLLQWLIELPLSVEALNQRFLEDPLIGKSLSNDSVWLYVNTLKALGCKIRRPGPKNQFRYELLSHPFTLPLTDAQLEMFSQVKAFAHQHFDHQEMRVLDRLLKKIVHYAACENPQETIEQLFSKSRSFDYETRGQYIEALEHWAQTGQLLAFSYHSPLKGPENFHFLPEFLYYEQGAVYIRGEHPEFTEPSSLRVDRILSMEPASNEELTQHLKQRRALKTDVVIRINVPEPVAFEGFGLTTAHGVYEEHLAWCNPNGQSGQPGYEVRLQVRDFFYLKQRLLSCGFAFQILSPMELREELTATLQAMQRLYALSPESNEVHHGAG